MSCDTKSTGDFRPVNPADFDGPLDYLDHCLARCAELARFRPDDGPAPAEHDADSDTLDVDSASLDWWRSTPRGDEWHDVDGVMECGYTEFDGPGEDAEVAEVERYLRPRARSMRVDADEDMRACGLGR